MLRSLESEKESRPNAGRKMAEVPIMRFKFSKSIALSSLAFSLRKMTVKVL